MTFPILPSDHALVARAFPDFDLAETELLVQFACYVRELGLGFHPDTRGADYVERNGARVFTDAEAAEYDRVIRAVHGFADPYELGIKIWETLGLVP